jgi:hypothetical protein
MVPPISLVLLPARNRELDNTALWLRNEVVSMFVYKSVLNLMVFKMVDNMPVTLFQMYVETEKWKFNIKMYAAATISLSYGKQFVTKIYVESL